MKKIVFYIISLLLMITCLRFLTFLPLGIGKEEVQFPSHNSEVIRGTLYSPSEKSSAGVVLIHGVVVNKEFMATMAKTLAAHHIAALTIDLGGFGESYSRSGSEKDNVKDVLAAIQFLRNHNPEIEQVGLIGHSMGGAAAIQTAMQDSKISSVACIGMGAEAESMDSDRLLFVTGLYDPFHPPSKMRELSSRHQLYVSPTATHQTELLDHHILKKVTGWMLKTLKDEDPVVSLDALKQSFVITLASAGFIMSLCLLLCPISRKRLTTGLLILTGVIIFALSYFDLLPPIIGSTMIMLLLVTILISGFWNQERHRSLVKLFILVPGILLSIDLVNIINSAGEYVSKPDNIFSIPSYLIQTLSSYLPLSAITVRPYLFTEYTSKLIPSVALVAVVILELVSPGIFLRIITGLTEKVLKSRQSRFTLSFKISPKQLLILSALFVILCGIIWQRVVGGFLNQDALGPIAGLITKRILPATILIFILLKFTASLNWAKNG